MLTMWTEICPKSKRFLSLFWFSLFWTTGTVELLSLLAYYSLYSTNYKILIFCQVFIVAEAWILDWNNLLEWRLFDVIISFPTALALGYSFFIYETPSYLVISGEITEAVQVSNKKVISDQ